MDAIITNLEKSFKSLATKVRHSVQNEEILKETAEVEKIIRSASVKKTQPKLRKVAVTQLPTIRIPEIFHLKKVLALPFKLAPPPNTRISVPQHLNLILSDYNRATEGSPQNEAMIRSRIDAIMLTTLAQVKRDSTNPRSSVGSSSSASSISTVRSLHLQYEFSMKLEWTVDKELVLIEGIVDYSLWYGQHNNHASNMAMVEAKNPAMLSTGVLQCLAYMAIIQEHNTRAHQDTHVCGIATDSDEWHFLILRPDRTYIQKKYNWLDNSEEVVSMIYEIFRRTGELQGPKVGRMSSGSGFDARASKSPRK
ncbi:uncharacterized protein N7529_001589 [Penicillium soppii]|uniref:uncharacterized protein n=1 Tax=Penicillium soppii TaxID=69789 RepID=UPI00254700DB|nr:uncharacterized protein N7529_001589 [Penicillium soppii]KAJ5876005.1 hypothetical protein N7529_001589 [Penicillium soppii]